LTGQFIPIGFIDKSVIEDTKVFASKRGKSLSQIVENYLKSLPEESRNEEISSNVKKLVGIVRLPKDFDYKKNFRTP